MWTLVKERAKGRKFWVNSAVCPPSVVVPLGISIDYKTLKPLITYYYHDINSAGEASVAVTRDFADFMAYYEPVGDRYSPFPPPTACKPGATTHGPATDNSNTPG